MNDSEDNPRIARLLQAAVALYANGHTRADAVPQAIELEKLIIAYVNSERLKEN